MSILDHFYVDQEEWKDAYRQVTNVIEDNASWWPQLDEPMLPLLAEETQVADGVSGLYIIGYLGHAEEFGPFGQFVYIGESSDVGRRLRGYARGSSPEEAVVHEVMQKHWLKAGELWDHEDSEKVRSELYPYMTSTRPQQREYREAVMRNASLGFRFAEMSETHRHQVEQLLTKLCAKVGIPLWNTTLYVTMAIWPKPNPHLLDGHIMWALDLAFGHL